MTSPEVERNTNPGAPGDESNARPPEYKTGALPAELRGHEISLRLCPRARDRRAGLEISLHMGGYPVHIPALPIPRQRAGGGTWAHPKRNGADDEVRTHGLDLGKVALCRLSYVRISLL